MLRKPSLEDYENYDGAHCHLLWKSLQEDWRCPACKRTKFEIMRWTKRNPNGRGVFWGWMAGLHKHHDHAIDDEIETRWANRRYDLDGRFPQTIICDQCNAADGAVKRKFRDIIPVGFSFSPEEISQFITAQPHSPHTIDHDKAWELFTRLSRQTP
jgi:predicted Fe-S protein YdhL (DUF1289 family)